MGQSSTPLLRYNDGGRFVVPRHVWVIPLRLPPWPRSRSTSFPCLIELPQYPFPPSPLTHNSTAKPARNASYLEYFVGYLTTRGSEAEIKPIFNNLGCRSLQLDSSHDGKTWTTSCTSQGRVRASIQVHNHPRASIQSAWMGRLVDY